MRRGPRGARTAFAVLMALALSGCFGDGTSDWAYEMVGIRALQDQGLTGAGIVVAVVDTGFNPDHPSLDEIKIEAWKDLVNDRLQPYDDNGHGSHVASILAGKGGTFSSELDGFNLKGAAPGVRLIAIKAIRGDDGRGQTADVEAGIDYAVQQGADIICLSLGQRSSPLNLEEITLENAINRALNQGILVVASAGNEGTNPDRTDVETPAETPGVIAVGAVTEAGRVADFSSRSSDSANDGVVGGFGGRPHPDKKPETVAPGVNIKGAWKGNSFVIAQGTSQAAPFVCGGLALLLEKHPELRRADSRAMVDDVKSKLRQTAKPLLNQDTPHDNAAGYGLFRADALVAAYDGS